MMAELCLKTYRFSISWSRVLPEGRGRPNPAGLDFYHRLVSALLAHDIVTGSCAASTPPRRSMPTGSSTTGCGSHRRGRVDHAIAAAVRPGDLETIAQPLDWIGISYYFDILLRGLRPDEAGGRLLQYPTTSAITDSPTRQVHTDMGWPITPDGLTELLVRLNDDYTNLPPVYITENGAGPDDAVIDGSCDDPRRIDYLDLHLRAIRDAIDDGVDVRGYFQWLLLDNFEWALGYDKRFGLVHVDFDTMRRTLRASAYWYRDVIRGNGLDESASAG